MARVARVVIPGVAHHVTQRGNRRQDVFLREGDYGRYLALLKRYAEKHRLRLWAYCLMSNHIHLVAVPSENISMGRALRDAHTAYALWTNKRERVSGHLWQGRFFSCPLDDAHLWAAVRYVERNPLRAGIVTRAEDYSWSSARAHCGVATDRTLAAGFPPPGVIDNWSTWLRQEDPESTDRIRRQTHVGRPCGSPSFVEGLEQLLGRTLGPKRRGPKPKHPRATAPEGHTTQQI